MQSGPKHGNELYTHELEIHDIRLSLADIMMIGIVEAPGQPGVSATLEAWMLMASATLSSSD
eukprot:3072017-Rhodomonas_salina.1